MDENCVAETAESRYWNKTESRRQLLSYKENTGIISNEEREELDWLEEHLKAKDAR